jgi:transcriptional antiterminator RfaH
MPGPVSLVAATPRAGGVQEQPAVPGQPWFVCVTKPRQEHYAASKLQEQGYEFYLPLLDTWVRQAGAWHKKQSIMFPRYGFVRPSRPGQAIGPVRSTPGVTSLVCFGHVLAWLSAERMDALRTLVAARSCAMPGQPFEAGQQVVFCAGPLKGASGIVSSVAAERVMVLMSLLGREQTVAVNGNDLVCA